MDFAPFACRHWRATSRWTDRAVGVTSGRGRRHARCDRSRALASLWHLRNPSSSFLRYVRCCIESFLPAYQEHSCSDRVKRIRTPPDKHLTTKETPDMAHRNSATCAAGSMPCARGRAASDRCRGRLELRARHHHAARMATAMGRRCCSATSRTTTRTTRAAAAMSSAGCRSYSRVAMMFGLPKDAHPRAGEGRAQHPKRPRAARHRQDRAGEGEHPQGRRHQPVRFPVAALAPARRRPLHQHHARLGHPRSGLGQHECRHLSRHGRRPKDTIPMLLWRAQNCGQDCRSMATRAPRRCRSPSSIGWEPCMPFCAGSPMPTDVSEYDVMGAIRGAPVELVECETVPLRAGVGRDRDRGLSSSIDPATFEMEGPFGEFTGYFGGDQATKPPVRVTCITHRNNPIMRGTLEGTMPKMLNENSIMSSVQRSALPGTFSSARACRASPTCIARRSTTAPR